MLPVPDELTSFFWDAARRGALAVQACLDCGRLQHPPQPVCHWCQSFSLGTRDVSGRGTVYSYTMAVQAFHPYFADKLPYCIAVVELAEQPGLKLVTNIIDVPEQGVKVGDTVEVQFRPLGDSFVLPVFRVAAG